MKRASYNLGTGWNQMVASCDSVLLINTSTNAEAWGLLQAGAYTAHGSSGFFHVTLAAASCDSVVAYDPASGFAVEGHLSGGNLSGGVAFTEPAGYTNIAATDTGALFYGKSTGTGEWGSLVHGVYTRTGTASSFTKGLTSIAGTANTVLFYRSGDGAAATSTLVNGAYGYVGGVKGIAKHWTIIAGGK